MKYLKYECKSVIMIGYWRFIMKKIILSVIRDGCVIFTVITLLFYSLGGIISGAEQEFIPSLLFIWLFFLFSVLLSCANLILRSKKIKFLPKILLHFTASFAIYFVTVVLCGGYIKNGGQTLVALTLFCVLYAVFAIIYLVKSKKAMKKAEKSEKYKPMF